MASVFQPIPLRTPDILLRMLSDADRALLAQHVKRVEVSRRLMVAPPNAPVPMAISPKAASSR